MKIASQHSIMKIFIAYDTASVKPGGVLLHMRHLLRALVMCIHVLQNSDSF